MGDRRLPGRIRRAPLRKTPHGFGDQPGTPKVRPAASQRGEEAVHAQDERVQPHDFSSRPPGEINIEGNAHRAQEQIERNEPERIPRKALRRGGGIPDCPLA